MSWSQKRRGQLLAMETIGWYLDRDWCYRNISIEEEEKGKPSNALSILNIANTSLRNHNYYQHLTNSNFHDNKEELSPLRVRSR